jgi:hypothetical protein
MTTGIDLADPLTADLGKKTKQQLLEFIFEQHAFYKSVSNGVVAQAVTIKGLSKKLERTQQQLVMGQEYVEQARVMIEGLMERWDDYDV